MSLPYDPHKEEAVAIAPLVKALLAQLKHPGDVGHCAKCGNHVWINKETGEFTAKNEVQILCPPCAIKFEQGEI